MAETVHLIEISTLNGQAVTLSVPSNSTVADIMIAVAKDLQPTSSFQLVSDQVVLKDITAVVPEHVTSLTCAFLCPPYAKAPSEDASIVDPRALAIWKDNDPETLERQPEMSSRYLRHHRLADWHDLGEYAPSELGAYRVFAFTLIDGADIACRMLAVIYDCGGGLDGVVYLRPLFQVGPLRMIARIIPCSESASMWEVSDDTWYKPPIKQLPSCENEQAGGQSADTTLKLHLAHAISCGLWPC